jgi:MFS family permease
MVSFSLIILVYDLTKETLYVTILVVLVSAAPILFSTFAGIFADTFDRRRVMLMAHLLRFILGFVMLAMLPFPIMLLPIAFLLASVAQFFEPAQVSSIPTLVPHENLFMANSLFSFTRYTMFLVGYTIAGPILAHTSAASVFIIIIGLYSIALFSVWTLKPLRQHITVFGVQLRQRLKDAFLLLPKRFKEGFQLMREDKVIAFLSFQVSFIFAMERGFLSLAPAFILTWLDLTAEDISLFVILPTGIGTLVGTLMTNVVKKKLPKKYMVTFGTLLDGLCLVLLSLYAPISSALVGAGVGADHVAVYVVAVLAFFSGFADPFIIVPAQTVMQERTPKEKRGRIFGNLVLLMNVLGLIPVLAIGLLSKAISVVPIIGAMGALILIVGFYGVWYWRRFGLEQMAKNGPLTSI